MSEKIIFDCDNTMGLPFKEVDDGLTLLYLLGLPSIELLGITTTFGNGSGEQVYQQTIRLAKSLSLNIPINQGENFAGESPNTPAARFLVEMVNAFPHQITLLATGPVGNLQAASTLDAGFYTKLKRILAMGGYLGMSPHVDPHKGLKLGYRYLHELNFSANPAAARGMLLAGCPVTIFPGNTCLDAPYTFKDIHEARWWPRKFRHMLRRWLLVFGLYCGLKKFFLWDLLPAVYLNCPECFEIKSTSINLSKEHLNNGLLYTDPSQTGKLINIATKIVDQSKFYTHLNTAWQRTSELYPPPDV
jgi:inosine-uridine nucleoside N-ribohydrolase